VFICSVQGYQIEDQVMDDNSDQEYLFSKCRPFLVEIANLRINGLQSTGPLDKKSVTVQYQLSITTIS
jgi:hypothetical protein